MTRRSPDTPALIGRAQRGDMAAAGRLMASVSDRLSIYVRLRLGARLRMHLDPLDVVQETFTAALQALCDFSYRGPRSFEAWLCRIAENVIRGLADHHGAQKRTPPAPPQSLSAALNVARRSLAGPATFADAKAERERLHAAMRRLDDDQRELLLLRHFESRSYDEIAAMTEANRTTVRRRVARAEHRLGTLLAQDAEANDGCA